MKLKKSLIATAIAAALSGGTRYAEAVVGDAAFLLLRDWDGQGSVSGVSFNDADPPDGKSGHRFGFAGEKGCTNSSSAPLCESIIPFDHGGGIDTEVFTSGIELGGNDVFFPNTTGSMSARVSDGVMTWDRLPFGGTLNEVQQFLGPDLVNGDLDTGVTSWSCTGFAEILDPDDYDCFGIVATWSSATAGAGIADTQLAVPGNALTARWRLEGVVAVEKAVQSIPGPGTAWLVGSGLVGLAGAARRKKARKP